jgi:Putative peptidoglycan binding domain
MSGDQRPMFDETIGMGDSGAAVAELQQRLEHLGYYTGSVDGQYGESTEAAVREFQSAIGENADGIVGTGTWRDVSQHAHNAGYDVNSFGGQGDQGAAATQQYSEDTGGGFEVGALSEDGQWMWDGSDWQPVSATDPSGEQQQSPEVGQLSEDGYWKWDGTEWVPAADGGAEPMPVDPGAQPGETPLNGESAPAEDDITPEQFSDIIAQSVSIADGGEMA